jgi:hypothetical protein
MAKGDKKTLKEINELLKEGNNTIEQENKLLAEKNYLLEQEIDYKRQSLDLSGDAINSIRELLGLSTKRSQQDKDLLKANTDINKQIYNQSVGIGSIESKTKQIIKNNEVLRKGKVQESSLEAKIADVNAKGNKARLGRVKTAVEVGKKLAAELKAREEILKDETLSEETRQQALDSRDKEIGRLDTLISKKMSSLSKDEQSLVFTRLNIHELENQNKQREKELKIAEKLKDTMGMTGKLGKLLGTIPGLGGIAGDAVSEVESEIQKSVEKGGKIPSKMKAAGMIFTKMKDNVKKALTDPLTIAIALSTQLVKAFKAVDEQSGEFAKSQGLSYATTVELRGEMSSIARSSKDILVTSKGLMESQARLSNLMGSQVRFSDEMLEDFTQLDKRLKMSEKTQELIAFQSLKTGKSAKGLTAEINGQVLKQNEQRKISMSFKEVQDAIGESSKAIRLNFGGSVKELVNQVSAAKALGTNLAGVEDISSSLLDFESSIQAELEAELLLGKEINLEKARQAALQGDMATVADEVLKNTAIMNAFETKNVIAQEKAAAALGMSRNDLANMVTEQQQLEAVRANGFEDMKAAQAEYNDLRAQGYSAEEAALATGGQALQDQMESASAAERLAAVMEQIQEIFIGMAEPILGLVNGILEMTNGAENLGKILMGIAGTYLIIKTTQLALKGFQAGQLAFETTKAAIMGTQAAAAITTNAASTFGIGTVIAVGAATAAIAALATYLTMKDGEIDYSKGPTVSGEFGTVQLDKNDTGFFNNGKIKAGTDLLGENKPSSQGGGGGNATLITKIDQLIAINKQILAKNPVISMNSNKVSDEMQKSERLVSA